MSKSQRKHIERVNGSKKNVIKRIDIPMDDIEHAKAAAESLMEAATNIKDILDLNGTTVFNKLRWAQSELQGAAINIRERANPALRKYYAELEAETTDRKTLGQNVIGGRTLTKRDIRSYIGAGASEAEILRIQASVGDTPYANQFDPDF